MYITSRIPRRAAVRGVLEMLRIYMREHSKPPNQQAAEFANNPWCADGRTDRQKDSSEHIVDQVIEILNPEVSLRRARSDALLADSPFL